MQSVSMSMLSPLMRALFGALTVANSVHRVLQSYTPLFLLMLIPMTRQAYGESQAQTESGEYGTLL